MADKNCHKNSPKDKLIPKSEQYPEKHDEKHKYLLIPKKLAQHLQYLYQQGKLIISTSHLPKPLDKLIFT